MTSEKNNREKDLTEFKGFAEHVLKSEPFDMQVSNHGFDWWKGVLTVDQQAVLNKVKIPVLVVQGGRDEFVSPKAVMNMIDSLHASGKANIELSFYPDLDHGLSTPDGRYMAEQVTGDINLWLKAKLQPNHDKSMQPAAPK